MNGNLHFKNLKALVFICLLFFMGFSSCRSGQKAEDKTEFKVMVWNILHGGMNENLPGDGRPDVIDIIKATEADVILMIETYGCAEMLADSLGYSYELLSSNLCIYSRFPIVKKMLFPEQISNFNFGGVQIMVDGKAVNVFDTWLHYLPDTRLAPIDRTEAEILAWENEGSRDDEVRNILNAIMDLINDSDSIPIIMGGDFNSHSHLDWTESTKGMYNHGNKVVDWTISREMTDAGFEDTFRKIHEDPVENIGTTWFEVRNEEGIMEFTRRDRIDYLYSMGEGLKIKDSYSGNAPFSHEFIFEGRTYNNYPSDHGFVVTTFEL